MLTRHALQLEQIDLREAARYADAGNDPETLADLDMAAREVLAKQEINAVYTVFTVEHTQQGVVLREANLLLPSQDLSTLLQNCTQAILACVTLGHAVEGLLRTYSQTRTSWSILVDACASSAVESACDQLEKVVQEAFPKRFFTDRFSPGYGDMDIALQKPVCRLLDTQRKVGVTVSQTCLLTPRKTVTFLLGVSDIPQATPRRGCALCPMNKSCDHRKCRGASI